MKKEILPKGTRVQYYNNELVNGTITAANNRSYSVMWDHAGMTYIHIHDEIIKIFPEEEKQYEEFKKKIEDRME